MRQVTPGPLREFRSASRCSERSFRQSFPWFCESPSRNPDWCATVPVAAPRVVAYSCCNYQPKCFLTSSATVLAGIAGASPRSVTGGKDLITPLANMVLMLAAASPGHATFTMFQRCRRARKSGYKTPGQSFVAKLFPGEPSIP